MSSLPGEIHKPGFVRQLAVRCRAAMADNCDACVMVTAPHESRGELQTKNSQQSCLQKFSSFHGMTQG